jgi:hypothetical protein
MKNQTSLIEFLKKPIVIIAMIVFGIIYSVFFDNEEPVATKPEPAKVEIVDFSKMSYEEKQKHIENYLKHTDDTGYEIMTDIRNAITKKFNYPKTVKFDWSSQPIFDNAYVVEADSGWVHLSGRGTAENAYKQKSTFHYSVKLKITDKEVGILDVKVNK